MFTLMVSISGIRGIVGNGLDPKVIVKYTAAYAEFCGKGKIVVGSDGRISGEMVKNIIIGTLQAKGNDVVDIGICPTPTVLFNVKNLKAVGGIQISASHNPNEWNALKLLNRSGEFMSPEEHTGMMKLIETADKNFKRWNKLGKLTLYEKGLDDHVAVVLKIPFINIAKIRRRKFKVVLDCVNGAGAYSMPKLLEKLGCKVVAINSEKSGIFPRLPEPIPENLKATMRAVKKAKADIGIVVDPDVDRLVLITEKGEPFSEENTITQAIKFYLSKKKGNAVVNLSTTRAVDDVAAKFGCKVFRAPVGEANVVKKMKEVKAVIGGEGSGGVILPKAVFGRDALTGTVIMLQHLLEFGGKMSELKKSLPQYFITKKKIEIGDMNADQILAGLVEKYRDQKINLEDGLRIDFEDHWVHLRKSNTEPIIRGIVEAKTKANAESLAKKYFGEILGNNKKENVESMSSKFNYAIGSVEKAFLNKCEEFKSSKVAERIWQKDFTLWSDKPDEITNRLGWLTSPQTSLSMLNEINDFVDSVRKEGFKQALLLGMGGSSLAPEVFRFTFGVKEGYLDLAVLDSTDSQAVLNYAGKFDPKETLYIVSTKSGGTVETFSFMKYFYNLTIEKVGQENVGKHFVAITDPNSGLESTAKQLNYRKIFLNDPNIGGRYSALSLFGVVPAALIGIDISKLLTAAGNFAESSKQNDIDKNIAASVGIIMGELAKAGRDKVTFITSQELASFGVWVEQLIAESTGKIGKGILPVVGEEILSPENYSDDRLFIHLSLKNDDSNKSKIEALKNAGHPVVELELNDVYELGAEFFRWEIATIVASWIINIQPFDQPNVESAKIVARKMVQEYKENGKLPELPISIEENGMKVSSDISASSLQQLIEKFFGNVNHSSNPQSYLSIQGYLTPTKEIETALQNLRIRIQNKYKLATTVGFGPRFLHSTGQLHKGDAGNGLFIQFTTDHKTDAAIPDEAGESKSSMTFGVLINSQALGDRQALLDNNRKLITINLGDDVIGGIKKLSDFI